MRSSTISTGVDLIVLFGQELPYSKYTKV